MTAVYPLPTVLLSLRPALLLEEGDCRLETAKRVEHDTATMDRQQVIAVIFAVLMVGSMVVYGASAFF